MRIIRNYDVASLYPSLMVKYGYTSRNIPDREAFTRIYWERLEAKARGDKAISDAFKLVLNTSYGAQLNPYNELYDPLMARSICITGQLLMTLLVKAYIKNLETVRIIQTNTDGVLVSLEEREYSKLLTINEKWERFTNLSLEEDRIKKVVQANVNNYLIVTLDGRVKTKGALLTGGISQAGAWNINNDYPIVKLAVKNYLTEGIPVERTIGECDDILQFQFIARASSRYSHVFHVVNNEKVTVQKVNRVYAVSDPKYHRVYKVHGVTGRASKIPNTPDRCLIDNENRENISIVQKEFYVRMAKSTIERFGERLTQPALPF